MSTHKHKETDIAKQTYKGPTQLAAGLGEGAVHGKVLAIGGFFLGGIAAFCFPEAANKLTMPAQKWVGNLKLSENGLKRAAGILLDVPISMGEHLSSWITNRKFVKNSIKHINENKLKATLSGAIMTSAAGATIGGVTGGGTGIQSARAARHQVKELQEEVSHLRKKVVDKETEIDDIKTANAARTGALNVAPDTQHDTADASEHKGNWADTVAAEKSAAKEAPLSL